MEGTHRWGISPLPWEADVGEVGPILLLKTGDQAAEIQKTQVAVTEPQAKVRAVDCEHGLTGPVVVVEQPAQVQLGWVALQAQVEGVPLRP
tara:strand:+ start:1715 stop:1987 length:273 start_codon:yes stop_codon:yes gene_type:complete